MALVNCPECGREISDLAFSCPHCGYPIQALGLNPEYIDESEVDESELAETDVVATPEQPAAEAVVEESADASGSTKLPSRNLLTLLGCAVLIALLVFGINTCNQNKQSASDSTTSSASSTQNSSSPLSLPEKDEDEKTDEQGSEQEPEEKPEESAEEGAQDEEPSDGDSDSFLDILATAGTFEDVTVTGTGDDVIKIPCAGTPCLIVLSHEGEDNFVVKSYDSEGSSSELLVNAIGSYYGVVSIYSEYEDATYLEIKADGYWTATFKPLNEMTRLQNGGTFGGDDVVYIDEEALTTLHIVHNGNQNFVIRAISIDTSKLLVNEIGAYDGTVIWSEPQSFFIIKADGQWSIQW